MIGKLIGFLLGLFAVKSPWGGLLGAILGHIVWDSPRNAAAAQARRELFLEYTCQALAKIAKADGVISREEINAVEAVFDSLGLTAQARRRAIGVFRRSKVSSLSVLEITDAFAEDFDDAHSRNAYMIILCRIASADGGVSAAELEILEAVAIRLGLDIEDFVYTRRRGGGYSRAEESAEDFGSRGGFNSGGDFGAGYSTELERAYAVLGVSPDSTDAEIKRVYRDKCKALHPDVMRSKGLDEIALKALEQELSRVNDAYSLIKKHRK